MRLSCVAEVWQQPLWYAGTSLTTVLRIAGRLASSRPCDAFDNTTVHLTEMSPGN